MTMWWQQNTCFGVFNPQSLSWEGNKQLYQHVFHSANFFSLYTSCLEERKNPKAVKQFISWGVTWACGGQTFSATEDGILHN